jgi:hypothetical protein
MTSRIQTGVKGLGPESFYPVRTTTDNKEKKERLDKTARVLECLARLNGRAHYLVTSYASRTGSDPRVCYKKTRTWARTERLLCWAVILGSLAALAAGIVARINQNLTVVQRLNSWGGAIGLIFFAVVLVVAKLKELQAQLKPQLDDFCGCVVTVAELIDCDNIISLFIRNVQASMQVSQVFLWHLALCTTKIGFPKELRSNRRADLEAVHPAFWKLGLIEEKTVDELLARASAKIGAGSDSGDSG